MLSRLRALVHPRASNVRIKTDRARHNWHITGDGSDIVPGIRKYPVNCSRCGEHRDITADFARFCLIMTFGCARDGFTGRYECGDHVIVRGPDPKGWRDRNYMARFDDYLPDGRIAASDVVGNRYVEPPENIQPDLA